MSIISGGRRNFEIILLNPWFQGVKVSAVRKHFDFYPTPTIRPCKSIMFQPSQHNLAIHRISATQEDSEVGSRIPGYWNYNRKSHFYLTLPTDLSHAQEHVQRQVDTCTFDIKKEVNRRSGHDSVVLSTRGHPFWSEFNVKLC